jgi:recombination DNA repair RAD52 pathway protein
MITPTQKEQLLKPLNPVRVANRQGGGGRSLSYLEAWDVKAHLIRIFGFGGWSWNVQAAELVYEQENGRMWNVAYKVIGQLTVPSLDCTYTEAAVGSSTLPQRGEAHDMAVKTAESDAIKRAAINLGDQFGLSLYNNGSTAAVVVQTLSEETE